MNAPVFPAAPPRCARAFTLVEMVITMAIFVLLAGAVFGIITGVLKSAGILQDDQNRHDQIMALQEFLRHDLNGLPGKAIVNSYQRGDGEGLPANGIIFGTPGLLTAIDAKLQPNGLYALRVVKFSMSDNTSQALTVFSKAVMDDDDSLNWRELIRDVKSAGWKFMPVNNPRWVDTWPIPTAEKPNLLQFTVLLAGETEPSVIDIWIPPISMQIIGGPPVAN